MKNFILLHVMICLILSVYGYLSDMSRLFIGASTFCACCIGMLIGNRIKNKEVSVSKTNKVTFLLVLAYVFSILLTLVVNGCTAWLNLSDTVIKIIVAFGILGVLGLFVIQYLVGKKAE